MQQDALNRRRTDNSFFDRTFRNRVTRRNLSESDTNVFGPTGLTILRTPSSEVFVEIVFVHGLRGGSRQAWSYSPDITHFWPQEWLPNHSAFDHARILSYGYNSDWMLRRENPMSIHDFGQALVEAIYNSPELRHHKTTKIIFVAHSMGGLVVKKSIITTRYNPTFEDLYKRFHAVFFFGTPHRGADLASTLNKYLKATLNTHKSFVVDLARGSEATNMLNEEFRHVYQGIKLHSFVETVPMNWHVGSGLIVEQDSAILGLPGEHIITIEADHRYMNKFESPEDSEFKKVQNCIAASVQDVVQNGPASRVSKHLDYLQVLASYLDISYNPEDELLELDDRRMEGSCEWLTTNESFQQWLTDGTSPRYLWLNGPPAAGKSILTASVARQIPARHCSYFFFKQGDHRSSLGNLFQSFAYQMGRNHDAIRDALSVIANDNFQPSKDDFKAIWRKIFINGVFQNWPTATQYWVIDALDECRTTGVKLSQHLHSILCKIETDLPLKIFISSRPTADIEQLLGRLPRAIVQVSRESTLHDIRRYVENSSNNLPVENEPMRKALVKKIIDKSCGCFLWVRLVISLLEDCWVSEQIEEVLEEVPEELEDLYYRNLAEMSSKASSSRLHAQVATLAKTILTWTLCATRPLSIEELKIAIKLDTNTEVRRDLEGSIASLCGHLVYVDKQGLVQIVHQTARAFLTRKDLDSIFQIDLAEGHLQLAIACLRYLCSEEMKYIKRQRRSQAPGHRNVTKSIISQYACQSFSEHLSRATSTSDALFRLLTTFLRTNVLTWIEQLAQDRDLARLINAAIQFKAYLGRRAKHVAALEDDVRLWARDLPRLVTEFGRNLLDYPAAIHELIPPLCPRNSIVHIRFANKASGIKLLGLTESEWYDRISCIYYKDSLTKCLACRDQRYATGLANGVICVYETSTCAEILSLDHGEPVRILKFGTTAKLLGSAGLHFVIVWDVNSRSKLLRIKMTSIPLSIAFDEKEATLVIASRSTEISTWSILSRQQLHSHIPENVLENRDPNLIERVPVAIEMSVESNMIAIAYRSRPLLIYDLHTMEFLGACPSPGRVAEDTSWHITAIEFNPNTDLHRLAVAYWDGDIAIFDTDSLKLVRSAKAESQILAVSTDGRTLAGGSSSGNIRLLDFETLETIHSISPSMDGVTALTFASDDRRLLDTRAYQINIWEPPVLTRDSIDDNQSEPSDAITLYQDETSASDNSQEVSITSVVCCFGGTRAICGRSNGAVEMYDLTEERPSCSQLYRHKGSLIEVSTLDWNEEHLIVASADVSGRFQVVRLREDVPPKMKAVKLLLSRRLDYAVNIQQLMISTSGAQILVSSSQADQVWSLETGEILKSYNDISRTNWKWFQHPSIPKQIIRFQDANVQAYEWQNFQSISEPSYIHAVSDNEMTIDIENSMLVEHNETIALKVLLFNAVKAAGSSLIVKNAQLYTIDISTLHLNQEPLTPVQVFTNSLPLTKPDIDLLIGTVISVLGGHLLLFMSKTGWICSFDLSFSLPRDSFQRHFFVPFAWLSSPTRALTKVTERRDILFVNGGEIALAINGLDEVENVSLQ